MHMQGGESIPVSAEAGAAEARVAAAPVSADVDAALEAVVTKPQEAEETKETPVIDVHAPQGGIHTWKDFWIHLGTIALGLLIAIGLEQTVEYFHHLHQRHQLEADLRTELEVNHRRLAVNQSTGRIVHTWLVALRDEVDRMRDSGGKLKLPYIPAPKIDPETKQPLPGSIQPTEAAWTTAKESELVGLLPRDEAEIYSRLEIQYDYLISAIDADSQSRNDLAAFETRFKPSGIGSDAPDVARMTTQDLNEYSMLLSRELSSRNYMTYRSRIYDQETEAILHGAKSEEELLQESLTNSKGPSN